MEKIGLWLFLTAIVLAPWVFGWLKERERQKSIRSFISKDGDIDPGILEHFRQLQSEELSRRRKPCFNISTIEQAIGWVVIALSALGGFLIMSTGIGVFGSGPNHSKDLLFTSFFVTFVVWTIGVAVGYRIYKRGSKNGSPPEE